MIEEKIRATVRDVPDFPKPGIVFKDITPVLLDAALCREISAYLKEYYSTRQIDLVLGVESRGFFFGLRLANDLNVPFAPVRKKGKLPASTIGVKYDLEYGEAEIEMHDDVVKPRMKVLIHDDLLATGGTAEAAAKLVEMQGGEVVGFDFLVELGFLNGREILSPYCQNIHNLAAWK